MSDVTNLAAWQCNLYFQSEVLNTTTYFDSEANKTYANVTEGPFLQNGAEGQTFFQAYFFTYNATYDLITFAEARLTVPASGVTGSGTVATINFTVIGSGASVLHLDASGFVPAKLVDSNNALIPFTMVDGDSTVVPEFPSFFVLPILMIATLLIATLCRARTSARRREPTLKNAFAKSI